jgi:hypothetical protein
MMMMVELLIAFEQVDTSFVVVVVVVVRASSSSLVVVVVVQLMEHIENLVLM